jgi:septal ring factor EnvC (AmiA/AmiB activator)
MTDLTKKELKLRKKLEKKQRKLEKKLAKLGKKLRALGQRPETAPKAKREAAKRVVAKSKKKRLRAPEAGRGAPERDTRGVTLHPASIGVPDASLATIVRKTA